MLARARARWRPVVPVSSRTEAGSQIISMVRGEEHSTVVLLLNKPSIPGAQSDQEADEEEEESEAASFEEADHLNLLP